MRAIVHHLRDRGNPTSGQIADSCEGNRTLLWGRETWLGRDPAQEEVRLRGGTSTRLHPKRRASIDHRPGPNIARAQLMVASKMATNGSPTWETLLHNSMKPTEMPAIGVQAPAMRRIPQTATTIVAIVAWLGASIQNAGFARRISATQRMTRIRSRPIPGQPPANVEYKRLNDAPFTTL